MANTIQYGRRSITIIPDGSTAFDLATVLSPLLQLNTLTKNTAWYVAGESVSQASSGATGIVDAFDLASGNLWLNQIVGTFNATNLVTGGTGGATGIPSVVPYAFPDGIRLSAVRFTPSGVGDILVIRGKGKATGPRLFDLYAKDSSDISRSVGGRSMRENIYILESECTFAVAANVRIVLEYD